MKKLKLIGAILYSVQLALSAVLVFYIFKLDVLPDSVAFGCVLVLTQMCIRDSGRGPRKISEARSVPSFAENKGGAP